MLPQPATNDVPEYRLLRDLWMFRFSSVMRMLAQLLQRTYTFVLEQPTHWASSAC
jgi:hypothetical protein